MPDMKHVLYVGREFMEDVDGAVDQNSIRSGNENSGACVVLIGPPKARDGGGSVVTQKLAVSGHHSSVIAPAPDRVEKSVTNPSLDGVSFRP